MPAPTHCSIGPLGQAVGQSFCGLLGFGEEATIAVLISNVVHCVIKVVLINVVSPEVLCAVTVSLGISSKQEGVGRGQAYHAHFILVIVPIKCTLVVPTIVIR